MRAARVHRFGGPEVLGLDEVPWVFPVRDEVLIRVRASSINGTDLHVRRGGLGPLAAPQRPFVPGFDVAGEVVGCGPSVTAFRPGDRVYALLGHRGGGAAEYAVVAQTRVAVAPSRISLTEAAAVPLSGLTALQALRGHARLRPGQRVLVYGAAGGIGSFAVRLAKLLGARVAAVARPAKHRYLRALGADEVMSPADLDLTGGGLTWDVIFDTPPALTFRRARAALTDGGVLVSTRPFPVRPDELAATLRQSGQRFAAVRTAERGQDLAFLARLIDTGELSVPVDRVFPLSRIREAHTYAEGDEVCGKVVVEVSEAAGPAGA